MCFRRKQKLRVHYEDTWSHYEECRRIVEEERRQWGSWYDGDPVKSFQKATNNSMARLLAWSKREFNNKKEKMKRLKKKLDDMKVNYQHYEEADEFKSTKDHIERLLLDEEVYWKQRSRADWLKEGNKNTKFFHLKVSSWKKKRTR